MIIRMTISIENIQIMFVQCEENTNKVQLMVILVIKKLLLEYCCWSLVDFQSRFTEILKHNTVYHLFKILWFVKDFILVSCSGRG